MVKKLPWRVAQRRYLTLPASVSDSASDTYEAAAQ